MKSSYPFGSSPNLELWYHHRILKTHIRHYDVICSYIENTYTTLWRHANLCCLCQMQNTNGLCCLCQNSRYKWLFQGKGSQIQINSKTIIEFCSRRIWGIIKASVCTAETPGGVWGGGYRGRKLASSGKRQQIVGPISANKNKNCHLTYWLQ